MPGLDNFTPTIWASSLLSPFYKALVFGGLANRDYEGEISAYGDSVKINEIGDITIGNYSKFTTTGSTSTALTWQALTAAQKMLYIDKAKTFSFAIDDVDMAQNHPKVMAEAMSRAGYALADTVDQDIAAAIVSSAGAIATAAAASAGTILGVVSNFARRLDEANVPQSERFLVVNPYIHQALVLAYTGGVSAIAVPKTFEGGVLANGFVGNVYGFNVLMSNNLVAGATAGSAFITAFHRSAVTFAGQLSQMKAVEREDYFDQGVKGLYLYGVKVVRPAGVVIRDLSEG